MTASSDFPDHGGDLGARMRSHDWSRSALGPPSTWPQSLRLVVRLMLDSKFPMFAAWGDQLSFLYNDAYTEILGEKHPDALGARFADIWSEIWTDISPLIDAAMAGEATYREDLPLIMNRRGFEEQTWFTFSYSPLRDETGLVRGMFCACSETTETVLADRIKAFRISLDDAVRSADDPQTIMATTARLLGEHLGADRAGYAEIPPEGESFVIERDWAGDDMPTLSGVRRLEDFGLAESSAFRKGRTLVLEDASAEPGIAEGIVADTLAAARIRAALTVPLLKGGRLAAALYVHCREPRRWRAEERRLVREVAERTWAVVEQARAETALRESEARFSFALEAASAVGTWDWDIPKNRVHADSRFAQLYSVDAARAAAGAPIEEFLQGIHPDDREPLGRAIQGAIDSGGEYQAEYRLRQQDGSTRWVLARGRPYYDDRGAAVRFPGVVIDITGRKKAEDRRMALIELGDRLHDLFEPAEIAYAAAEILGRTLDVSRAGYGTIDPVAETITIERDWNAPGIRTLAGLLHLRDYGTYIEDLKRGNTVIFADAEKDSRTADNAAALRGISAQSVVNMPVTEKGDLVALLYLNHETPREWPTEDLEFIRDVANRTRTAVERARAEMALRELNSTLENRVEERTAERDRLWRNAQDLLVVVDDRGRFRAANPAMTLILGWSPEDILGLAVLSIVHPDDRERTRAAMLEARRETLHSFENRYRHKDGSYRWLSWMAAPEGDLIYATGRHITLEKEAAAALTLSQARLRAIFETGFQYQGLLTTDGTLIDANATSLAGIDASLEEVKGQPFWETAWFNTTPEMGERIREDVDNVAKGITVRHQIWVDLPTGRRAFDFQMRPMRDEEGTVVAIIPEALEITDRLVAEDALRQAQKMEAVGQLTGGIAHDFNNMLSVVIGSLDLLGRRIGDTDPKVRRYVDAAMDGARRGALLTQHLLAFSRQQPLSPVAVDPDRLITDMSPLLHGALGGNIRLKTVPGADHWRIHVDPNQLENVLLNLVVNARDALPDGGRVTIETHHAVLDARYATAHPDVPPGQYLLIAVTDTGEGMSQEVISKAFDPFFTTKEVGKGTGLGLSQVYGFVKQSGGHVKIYSEPAQGTSVKIYLPRLTTEESQPGDVAPESSIPRAAHGELVLVIEDDPGVRQFSVEALNELGYRVLEADGADAAVRMVDTHPGIDLVFTDVVLPETNGRQLVDTLRRRQPNLRVLFTTGYTRNAVVHNGVLDHDVEMIGKPFTIEELSTKIRKILDAPAVFPTD